MRRNCSRLIADYLSLILTQKSMENTAGAKAVSKSIGQVAA